MNAVVLLAWRICIFFLFLWLFVVIFFGFDAKAQTSNEVSLQRTFTYDREFWNMEEGTVGGVSIEDWDVAFDVRARGYVLRHNSAQIEVCRVARSGASWDFSRPWVSLNAPNVSWDASVFDGWGAYNPTTHAVDGGADNCFLLRHPDTGESWFFQPEQIDPTGVYHFFYGRVWGGVPAAGQRASLAKSDYAGKRFAYFSLSRNEERDLEPASNSWHLLFTRYGAEMGSEPPLCIFANEGVGVAAVTTEGTLPSLPADASFSTEISAIGASWRDGDRILPNKFYFVRSGDVTWRVVFKDYEVSVDDLVVTFTTEEISVAPSPSPILSSSAPSVLIAPNPLLGGERLSVYGCCQGSTSFRLFDHSGRYIHGDTATDGEWTVPYLSSGVYFVEFNSGAVTVRRRLVVE